MTNAYLRLVCKAARAFSCTSICATLNAPASSASAAFMAVSAHRLAVHQVSADHIACKQSNTEQQQLPDRLGRRMQMLFKC